MDLSAINYSSPKFFFKLKMKFFTHVWILPLINELKKKFISKKFFFSTVILIINSEENLQPIKRAWFLMNIQSFKKITVIFKNKIENCLIFQSVQSILYACKLQFFQAKNKTQYFKRFSKPQKKYVFLKSRLRFTVKLQRVQQRASFQKHYYTWHT